MQIHSSYKKKTLSLSPVSIATNVLCDNITNNNTL